MNDPRKIPDSLDAQADDDSLATRTPNHDTVPGDGNQRVPSTIDVKQPKRIGRYRVEKTLGEGGFGRVYQAYDEELKRRVAIKVPQPERISRPEDVEQYLAEAQVVASLDHPAIVPVYDVGRTDDGLCYVVSKIIEGSDLAERIEKNRPSFGESAELAATVAEALHYAHTNGLVHRDIKPANILIDSKGDPYVTDFGLALKEEDVDSGSGWAGTPAYMSPEQARGEGHRVDGRSDVFSLGVVFYELLTGIRPFKGDSQKQLLSQISSVEARPPRQRDDNIPKELERICLKSLSKKASDRYTTAKDMAEDLRHFLSELLGVPTEIQSKATDSSSTPTATPASDSRAIRVIPKGLRSFDAKDADFFLELLPGPRDRDGLPDSVRFWKDRVEETDADDTFRVGLIYGPSGCGKSSLVKAGLLPRLSEDVVAIYVEATPDETESRLLHGLRKQCPTLPDNLSLKETLAALRRGHGLTSGKKVLIVLDQFEQWLHTHGEAVDTELVAALRQCDGSMVQAIVMVRDDFWMAVTRFLNELEVELTQGQNFAPVDLFPIRHAEKVLAAFGRAFGVLPDSINEPNKDQKEFLKDSVAGLADEGKVICVHLALFAEMMKSKEWTPATLKEVGGTKGIGVTFLEETFSTQANPKHKLHQKAARAVLKDLLPDSGTDIKGHMRSNAELLEASGYGNRLKDFQGLISILDSELRLVTPTDPEADEDQKVPDSDLGQKYYQLTHDYLVPSLRDWLTRKQKETRRGRAELRLAERSALWNSKPENRHLAAWWEWTNIRCLTDKRHWSEPERKMMNRAGRVNAVRFSGLLIILGLLGWVGFETYGTVRGSGHLDSLTTASIDDVPRIVEELVRYRRWTNNELKALANETNTDATTRLHVSLALLQTDASQLPYLKDRLLNAEPEQVETIRLLLESHKDEIVDDLWQVVEDGNSDQLLQAASALAFYDVDNDAKWTGVAERVVDALVNENAHRFVIWNKTLRPARRYLVKPLGVVFRNKADDRSQTQINLATDVLGKYAADDLESLAELLLDAEPKQFVTLFDAFTSHGVEALAKLSDELDRELTFKWNDQPLDPSWTKPTTEVTSKIKQAHGMMTERFAFCQTMPMDDFKRVVEDLRKTGYRPIRLRPYTHNDSVRVTAAWTRDGRIWQLATGQAADVIQQQDEEHRDEGFVAVDVTGYIGEKESQPTELYAALWVTKRSDSEDSRIYAGASYVDHRTVYGALEKEGYEFQHSLQGFRGIDGQQKFCGVKTRSSGVSRLTSQQSVVAFDSKEYLDRIHRDIDPSNAPDTQTTKERNERALADAEDKLMGDADNLNARFARGMAYFYLNNDEKAVADFDFVIEKAASSSSGYQFRAILHARMNHAEEAKQDLATFMELSKTASTKVYLDAVVSSLLGEDTEAMKSLETFIEANRDDTGSLYDAACAYSITSGAFKDTDAAKSNVFADRAVSLITLAVSKGYSNYSHMQEDADLDPIRQHDGFIQIMKAGNLGLRYSAVWNTSTDFVSLESHGLSPTEHLAKCQEMQTRGYRLTSISSVSINGEQVTASVWHRPLIPEVDKETLARRQANAAIAALRMGHAGELWPLLKHSPDPRLRTWIIHRLNLLGASPDEIVNRLNRESDDSIRRALILALGDYEDASLVDRKLLVSSLLELYRDNPDPGIHAAAEWVLRRWGKEGDLAEIDTKLATGKAEGERNWYVTKQGHTMVVIPGPVEFLMGSPDTEKDRSNVEYLHRQGIGRSFAIATKEVTVKQFQEFLRQTPSVSERHSYTKKYAPEENCPQISVTWYEAAAYCRWLSEQEGVSDNQMCYPPIADIKDGMDLPPNYLSRTGYRLPSEAEWEYACRSKTLTSRYYGQTVELLGQYGWFIESSQNRTWPVGSLKPNDTGLFDMYGNVYEWCQERYVSYSGSLGSASEDREDNVPLKDSTWRSLRGSSFNFRTSNVRSAYRNYDQSTLRTDDLGFRPSRTYNLSP